MIDIIMAIVGVVFIGLGIYTFFRRKNQQEETETNPKNSNLIVGAYVVCGVCLLLGSLANFTLAYAIGMLISVGGSIMIARQQKNQ